MEYNQSVPFAQFTIHLFDTPEIPQFLNGVRRVLGIISLSRAKGNSIPLRIYEWVHRKWPKYVDCRPIYLEHLLRRAGYTIQRKEMDNLFVLPLEIIVAIK